MKNFTTKQITSERDSNSDTNELYYNPVGFFPPRHLLPFRITFFVLIYILNLSVTQAATKIWTGGITVSEAAGPKFDWSVGSYWSGGTGAVNGD